MTLLIIKNSNIEPNIISFRAELVFEYILE